jgi:hypothetical protein
VAVLSVSSPLTVDWLWRWFHWLCVGLSSIAVVPFMIVWLVVVYDSSHWLKALPDKRNFLNP